MLPYANNGGYGSGSYGRRKGFLSSQYIVIGVLVLVVVAALGFSVFAHVRASSANAQGAALKNELESARSELHSIKSQYQSRNAELEQLQLTHGHTQRRMTELTSQLHRKEAELRTVADQHRNGRETELTKMVEDLRSELVRSDGIIEALETKMAKMEATHTSREKDWHTLANKWIKYEQDLHEEYRKCSSEVSKLRNLTTALNNTEPIPEAEPQLRPETDFAQISTEIPVHKPHHFEPLPVPSPPPPGELPLPETKIRDSIVEMTAGKVGGNPGQQAPAGGATEGDGHKAPEPTQAHHHDVYHHEFHEDAGHHYDHYHGHYDSYDPMDEWWLHDAHGDWNADDHGHGHAHGGNGDDVHHNDQIQHDHKHDQHQYQHDHQNQQDQQRHHYQEAHNGGWGSHQHPSPSGGDSHYYQHHQPQAMHGMEQHVPNHWQQHDPHHQQQQHHQQHQQEQHHQQHQQEQHHQQHQQEQYQQQQQQYQQQQQQYQQHQQQYHQQQQQYQQHQQHNQDHQQHQQHYGEHQQHPKGDLAYKMGW